MGISDFLKKLEFKGTPGENPKVTNPEQAIQSVLDRVTSGTSTYGGWWHNKRYVSWDFYKGNFRYDLNTSGLKEEEAEEVRKFFETVSSNLKTESSLDTLSRSPLHGVHPTDPYIKEERLYAADRSLSHVYKIPGDDNAPTFNVLSLARKYVSEHKGVLNENAEVATTPNPENLNQGNGPLSHPSGFDRRYYDETNPENNSSREI